MARKVSLGESPQAAMSTSDHGVKQPARTSEPHTITRSTPNCALRRVAAHRATSQARSCRQTSSCCPSTARLTLVGCGLGEREGRRLGWCGLRGWLGLLKCVTRARNSSCVVCHLPAPQGTPEALPYPILHRLPSPSQSRAAPRYTWLRPLRRAAVARWAAGKSPA